MNYVYAEKITDRITACYTVDRDKKTLVSVNFLLDKKDVLSLDLSKDLVIKTLTIPNVFYDENVDETPINVIGINANFFGETQSIKVDKIIVSEGFEVFDKRAFGNVKFEIGEIVVPSTIKKIPSGCFTCSELIRKIALPDTITSIGQYAFCFTTALTSIKVPDSCKTISANAFYYSGIRCVEFGKKLKKIGARAFACCRNLKNVAWPETVSYIDDSVFSGCAELESIEINNTLTSIGAYAFLNTSLKKLDLSKSLLSPDIKLTALPRATEVVYSYYNRG